MSFALYKLVIQSQIPQLSFPFHLTIIYSQVELTFKPILSRSAGSLHLSFFFFFQQNSKFILYIYTRRPTDMLPFLPLSASILLCLSAQASAAPQSGTGQVAGQTMVLRKRALSPKTIDEWGTWAKEHREGLQAKYGDDPLRKRSTGTNL